MPQKRVGADLPRVLLLSTVVVELSQGAVSVCGSRLFFRTGANGRQASREKATAQVPRAQEKSIIARHLLYIAVPPSRRVYVFLRRVYSLRGTTLRGRYH